MATEAEWALKVDLRDGHEWAMVAAPEARDAAPRRGATKAGGRLMPTSSSRPTATSQAPENSK